MAVDSYFNRRRAAYKQRPTNWLWFFVNIRLPLGFLGSGITIFNHLYRVMAAMILGVGTYVSYYLLLTAFEGAVLGISIWTLIEARRFTPRGYLLIRTILMIETVQAVLNVMFESVNYMAFALLIGAAVMGLGWLLPNLIYFGKRKDLFQPDPNVPVILPPQAVNY